MLNYERKLLVDIIEDEFIEYVKSGILEFSVYGEQPIEPEEEENEEDAKSAKGTRSKRGSIIGNKGGKRGSTSVAPASSAQSDRIAKLESILREITSSIDPDHDPDKMLRESPEQIANKVKEIVVKEKALEEEVIVLKSPQKSSRPSMIGDGDPQGDGGDDIDSLEALRVANEENKTMRLELESLKRKGGINDNAEELRNKLAALESAAAAGGDVTPHLSIDAIRAENESLKAALTSLQHASSPTAVELANLTADAEAKSRQLALGEEELASMRIKLDAAEAEKAALQRIQEEASQARKQLEEKLAAATSPSPSSESADEIARLRQQLDSARGKIASAATPQSVDAALQEAIDTKDKELDQLRQQLKDSKKGGSGACVIL